MDLQRSWFPLIKTDKGNVNIADFKRAGMFAANKLIIDNAPSRTVTKISFAEHNYIKLYIKFPQQLSLQITDGPLHVCNDKLYLRRIPKVVRIPSEFLMRENS